MLGPRADDGTFYIDHAPDDETEYEFDGELADGEAAEVDVIIGGRFDAAGNPSPDGPVLLRQLGRRSTTPLAASGPTAARTRRPAALSLPGPRASP